MRRISFVYAVAVSGCMVGAPIEDFGVIVTPVKFFAPPGVEREHGRWVFGWVRVSDIEAQAYRFELGVGAKRQVHQAAVSAVGYTIAKHREFYREAARRFAEIELSNRGLCPRGGILASEIAGDHRTQTPSFVIKCASDEGNGAKQP